MKKTRLLLLTFLMTSGVCEAQHAEKPVVPREPIFKREVRLAEDAFSKGETWEIPLTNVNCKVGELVAGLDYMPDDANAAVFKANKKVPDNADHAYKVNIPQGAVTYIKTGKSSDKVFSDQSVKIGNVSLNNVVFINTSDSYTLSADRGGEKYHYSNNYVKVIDQATNEEICSFIYVHRTVAGLVAEFKTVVMNEEFLAKKGYQQKPTSYQVTHAEAAVASLLSFYPNPADNTVFFNIDVLKSKPVSLTVSDINGRRMATILDNQTLTEGLHKFKLTTSTYPSGVYIVKFVSNSNISESKLIIK